VTDLTVWLTDGTDSCTTGGMPPLHLVDTPGRSRRVVFSLASLGWRRALHEVATRRRPYDPETDHSFDVRHRTDTAGTVQPDDLGIEDGERRSQAIRYLPSPPRVTNWLLDRVDVDPASHAFVDLGCGKGRVVLIAAQRPFRQVVGVEVSARLAETARRNVVTYRPPPVRRSTIEIVEADAAAFDMPTSDLLIHLYHPFEPEVTAAVLGRLQGSLAASPRKVTIAYLTYTAAVAQIATMFGEFGWLHCRRYEQSIRGHYNWLIYSN